MDDRTAQAARQKRPGKQSKGDKKVDLDNLKREVEMVRVSSSSLGKERKDYLYNAFILQIISKRSGMDHTVLPANTPCLPFLRSIHKRSPPVRSTVADIQLQFTAHEMEICFPHHLLGGSGHHVRLPLGLPTFLVNTCANYPDWRIPTCR